MSGMPKTTFEPCIPARATAVPDRPEWIDEIKHDGYRLIVQREAKRVRLFTRNGHDWSSRYPLGQGEEQEASGVQPGDGSVLG
jgi:bifunctional non-homologous end joining protein LigD